MPRLARGKKKAKTKDKNDSEASKIEEAPRRTLMVE